MGYWLRPKVDETAARFTLKAYCKLFATATGCTGDAVEWHCLMTVLQQSASAASSESEKIFRDDAARMMLRRRKPEKMGDASSPRPFGTNWTGGFATAAMS
jgi:hypothetical protein